MYVCRQYFHQSSPIIFHFIFPSIHWCKIQDVHFDSMLGSMEHIVRWFGISNLTILATVVHKSCYIPVILIFFRFFLHMPYCISLFPTLHYFHKLLLLEIIITVIIIMVIIFIISLSIIIVFITTHAFIIFIIHSIIFVLLSLHSSY